LQLKLWCERETSWSSWFILSRHFSSRRSLESDISWIHMELSTRQKLENIWRLSEPWLLLHYPQPPNVQPSLSSFPFRLSYPPKQLFLSSLFIPPISF
jgi:hypothetical protein